MEKYKRIVWIDYLKTFACILVVIGHLIQSLQMSNIDNYPQITGFINWFIYLFHMPLFFCISGYLYEKNKKDFSWKNYKNFEIKKIINLAVPYFTFYILYVGINMMFSDSVNNPKGLQDLLDIFNKPIAPYWFLYTLLSIFIVIPIIEKICKNNKLFILFILLILKIFSIFVRTNLYFIDSIFSYSIYFYIGNFIKDKNEESTNFNNAIAILLYFILALVLYININRINQQILEVIKIFLAIIGIEICINNFKGIKSSKILDIIKKYTFQIFLLHTFFAAGVRIIMIKLSIDNYFIHFVIGLLSSLYLPVIVGIFSEKVRFLNFFFYPVKTVLNDKNINLWRKVEK